MKKSILVVLIPITYVISVFGQVRDSIPGIGLMELSQVNQGNSYVTFPDSL